MGRPAQELEAPGGERLLYFSRLPTGRQTFVARIEGDVLQSLAPCLTPQNFGRIVAAVTTTAEIREWLGPPWRSFRMERMEREVWEYPYAVAPQAYRIAWVQFSSDGVVREVVDGVDWSAYPQSGPRRR